MISQLPGMTWRIAICVVQSTGLTMRSFTALLQLCYGWTLNEFDILEPNQRLVNIW
jgi:hypothetical protein